MKPLVLYYSYSGNTKQVAEKIHQEIGGDIVRIETVTPYTGDYNTVVNQGKKRLTRGIILLSSQSGLISASMIRLCWDLLSGGIPMPLR